MAVTLEWMLAVLARHTWTDNVLVIAAHVPLEGESTTSKDQRAAR